jgi:hypothetical protein
MDLQRIVDIAKTYILENGNHPPLLYVEPLTGEVAPYFFTQGLPEYTKDKQSLFFELGRAYGLEHSIHDPVVHLYLIVEAWTSETLDGEKRKYTCASDDPDRHEELMILHLDAKTMKSTIESVQILRVGDTVDLLSLTSVDEKNTKDHMLPSFMAGIATKHMSDRDLAKLFTRNVSFTAVKMNIEEK